MLPDFFECNSRLKHLVIDLPIQSAPLHTSQLYDALLKLIARIGSTCLELLILRVMLPTAQVDDTDKEHTPLFEQPNSHEDIVSPFHAILSQKRFDGLTGFTDEAHRPVILKFSFFGGVFPPSEEVSLLSDVIQALVEVLFEPWLKRGLVRLELPSGDEIDDWQEVSTDASGSDSV